MNTRLFDIENDYDEVADWWKKQDWPIVSKEMLSKFGFIVEDGNKKIAASWGYYTGSCIYIMEWTVGNPDVEYEKREEAIYMLIETISAWAKKNGATSLLTMTKHDRFIDKLKACEFNVADTEVTHLMRRL